MRGVTCPLQTDYLDFFYLLPLDVGRAKLKAALGALDGWKRVGKIRHIGLSQVDTGTVVEADRILMNLRVAASRLDAVQSEFSMLWGEEAPRH